MASRTRRSVHQPRQDRLVAGLGSVLVTAALGAALLYGLAVDRGLPRDTPLVLIGLSPPPPPPPPNPPPAPRRPSPAARGAPAPPAPRARATPVVAPPPLVVMPPPPPPLPVATIPDSGAAARSGIADRAGQGSGTGGIGTGNGGGGEGDGEGDDSPPRQIRGRLSYRDLPSALRASGEGGRVGVRYRVETDGRVSGCTITEPSGRPGLDALTCQLITERFRFRPSRTADGTPVRAIIVERHEWVVEHDPDEADDPR